MRKSPGSASSTPRGTPLSHSAATSVMTNGVESVADMMSVAGDMDVDIMSADSTSQPSSPGNQRCSDQPTCAPLSLYAEVYTSHCDSNN